MKFTKHILFYGIGCFILLCSHANTISAQSKNASPVRLGVSGITHGHVGWILGRKDKSDVVIVGIYEPDVELSQQFAKKYDLAPSLFYTDLSKMLAAVKPEAVVAFGSIYQHMATVEACAPLGIHVMVEKPLATTIAQAVKMEATGQKA